MAIFSIVNFLWPAKSKVYDTDFFIGESVLPAMYLEANEKGTVTTYWGRPFRQKAVLEL